MKIPFFPTALLVSSGALLALSCAFAAPVHGKPDDGAAAPTFRLGQEVTVEGQTYLFLRKDGENLVFTPPPAPTASIGAFIAPVSATASSVQNGTGRAASKTIDGSGLREFLPGRGVYVHTNNVFEGGDSMWTSGWGDANSTLNYDLGQIYNLAGFYVWNYNEGGEYLNAGIKEVEVLASTEGEKFEPVGTFTLERANASNDYKGQTIAFKKPVKARQIRLQIKSNYGREQSGLSEIRFANADEKYILPAAFKPRYARPNYPKLAVGAPAPGAQNYALPADFGHADVTDAKYGAKGDGITDDTAAIQKALNENQGGIIYLPNGHYLVSDTLKWPGSDPTGGRDWKYTALQGQSREGAIIMLKDRAPGFDNPGAAKPVIWTGVAPAQRFANEVFNLTVDTGVGNLGAAGLHFVANNTGSIKNVAVVSGDGQGVAGIDFGYTGENGPLLVRDVKIKGFDVGISTSGSVNSQTMENVVVEDQNVVGVRDGGQVLNIRNLVSRNEVMALEISSGQVALDGANLIGSGDARKGAAISNAGALLATQVKTTGYARAIENRAGDKVSPDGANVAFFESPKETALFAGGKMLQLPVQETPELPWDDAANWVSIRQFQKPGVADADALQSAIDAGATTIYLPGGSYKMGKTVVIRGKVRRIIGEKSWFDLDGGFASSGQPLFRLEDGDAPVVTMERINTDFSGGNHRFLDHNSKRTLVLRQVAINFHASKTGVGYRAGENAGPLFLEDVVGPTFEFKNQNVWARQLNSEVNGTHIVNDGAKVWILGLKTERPGTIVETKNGGQTQLFGGLIYNIGGGNENPMFTATDSQLAAFVAEAHFSDSPYQQFVVESRGGQTKDYGIKGPFKGQRPIVYRSGG